MYIFIDPSSFLNSPVYRGYVRKVIVHLVKKYFSPDFSTDSIFCCEFGKKKSDENNIKQDNMETETRQCYC